MGPCRMVRHKPAFFVRFGPAPGATPPAPIRDVLRERCGQRHALRQRLQCHYHVVTRVYLQHLQLLADICRCVQFDTATGFLLCAHVQPSCTLSSGGKLGLKKVVRDCSRWKPACPKPTVEALGPDKFAWSEFEQLRWPNGQTSRMKFVIEPTGTYSRRVSVSKPVRAETTKPAATSQTPKAGSAPKSR